MQEKGRRSLISAFLKFLSCPEQWGGGCKNPDFGDTYFSNGPFHEPIFNINILQCFPHPQKLRK